MEDHDSGCEFNADNEDDIVVYRRKVNNACNTQPEKRQIVNQSDNKKSMLINNNDYPIEIPEENYNSDLKKWKENSDCVTFVGDKSDKTGCGGGGTDLRRHSSGYYSNTSDAGSNNTAAQTSENRRGSVSGGQVLTNRTNSLWVKKDSGGSTKSDFTHIKPKVDTGLKKSISISGSTVIRSCDQESNLQQKKSDPVHPQYRKKSLTSFKVPDLPTSEGTFNRNSTNRRSLTRLFGRNPERTNKKYEKSLSDGIKTPFGDVNKSTTDNRELRATSEEKRSQFNNKRSLTSLSLFRGSNKSVNTHETDKDVSIKERKNSFGRLRAARSSLDLSALGFGSLSKASSKATLTDLKEESDSSNLVKSESSKPGGRSWFDLKRVWKDQTQELPTDDMFHKMRKERSGRAQTVPSHLGSLETSSSVSDLSSIPCKANPTSCYPTSTPNPSQTPSTLKKTVHLLSPDVLTNWYEKRKKLDNLYGPRRNSISNLFFNSDKKQSASPQIDFAKSDKFHRNSMLNLEELLSGGNQGSGKGVQRSASAKLTNERARWRTKGIQRSESARLINMRAGLGGSFGLQPRQNSHPNLAHQLSCSSSSSSLADRSLLESPSKLTTYSLSATDPGPSPNRTGTDHHFDIVGSNPLGSSSGGDSSESDLETDVDPPDWRTTVTSDDLKKLSNKELKRQDVINELFHTERSHLRNLKVLNTLFREPLIQSGKMSRELIDKLFPNIEDVIRIHNKFNNAMRAQVKQTGYPIQNIGDIISDMFLDENGDQLVKVCGRFIRDQNFSIEELKGLRGRDGRLESFLSEIERNPACRRLQLHAILPCVHTRLTKYPLLLQQVAKYTEARDDNKSEIELVKAVVERTKETLEKIDCLVAEQQNSARLREIQANLDFSGLEKMGLEHPITDLTTKKLVYDGSLTMKLGDSKRVKALHVLLLQDCMMLLQKQGDKYLLKFHSSSSGTGLPSPKEDSRDVRRQFHSPIIQFSTMLVRPVATDKRAFYLINTTNTGPQIYELLASSGAERNKWIKYITEAQSYKSNDTGMSKTQSEPEDFGSSKKIPKSEIQSSNSFREQTKSPPVEIEEKQNSNPPEDHQSTKEEDETSILSDSSTIAPKKRMQRVEILKIVDALPMIDPSQVQVNKANVMVADPVVTPFEMLKQKNYEVSKILEEKQNLISEILHIPEPEFDTMAVIAETNSSITKDPRDILLAALSHAMSLTNYVNNSLTITEEDLVSTSSSLQEDVMSRKPAAVGPYGDQLVSITTSLNHHLTDLLAIMQERDEERDILMKELVKSQEQVKSILNCPDVHPEVILNETSRPESFISVESDAVDSIMSEKAHSPVSFSSADTGDLGTTTAESEEDTHYQYSDKFMRLNSTPEKYISESDIITSSSPQDHLLIPRHHSSPVEGQSDLHDMEPDQRKREWTPEGEEVLKKSIQ